MIFITQSVGHLQRQWHVMRPLDTSTSIIDCSTLSLWDGHCNVWYLTYVALLWIIAQGRLATSHSRAPRMQCTVHNHSYYIIWGKIFVPFASSMSTQLWSLNSRPCTPKMKLKLLRCITKKKVKFYQCFPLSRCTWCLLCTRKMATKFGDLFLYRRCHFVLEWHKIKL